MLHELVKYAEREGLNPEPGFKAKTVRWLLVFTPDGHFLGVQGRGGEDRKSKGGVFAKCPDLTDVELKSVIDGRRRRHFLADNLGVVVRFTEKDEVDEDTEVKHGYFCDMLDAGSEDVPMLGVLAAALRDETILRRIGGELTEKKAKATEMATLAVADEGGNPIVLVEKTDWHDWWRSYRKALAADLTEKKSPKGRSRKPVKNQSQQCSLLTGELVEPLASHPVINGVGGQPSGDRLISFDKESSCSYGLDGGANAAMSEEDAISYATALNDLLRYHSRRLAGVKVVYWYDHRIEPKDDPMPEVIEGFGPPEENGIRSRR